MRGVAETGHFLGIFFGERKEYGIIKFYDTKKKRKIISLFLF